jgi:hypothetical protein
MKLRGSGAISAETDPLIRQKNPQGQVANLLYLKVLADCQAGVNSGGKLAPDVYRAKAQNHMPAGSWPPETEHWSEARKHQ